MRRRASPRPAPGFLLLRTRKLRAASATRFRMTLLAAAPDEVLATSIVEFVLIGAVPGSCAYRGD